MKEAISENIKRAQIINNQLERKMLSTRKMLEKEKKSPGLYFKATFLLAQGLLYRWTEHSILSMTTGGRAFNPNNATQTHSIFVKI